MDRAVRGLAAAATTTTDRVTSSTTTSTSNNRPCSRPGPQVRQHVGSAQLNVVVQVHPELLSRACIDVLLEQVHLTYTNTYYYYKFK